MSSGVIFDIKRFALHDGRGLRTTLFVKGCPLRCPWCQNPEGILRSVELVHFASRCIACGECVASCPERALSLNADLHEVAIDQSACVQNGACVATCPTNALQFTGRTISAEAAVAELLRDRTFFSVSNGGVTLSGGEPLEQSEFAREVLARCHEAGVETAIETSLSAPEHVVMSLLPVTDQFLVDIKVGDAASHERIVGVPLHPIIANLRSLLHAGANVTVRVPLIPGFTTDQKNLREIASLVASLEPQPPVELINFNPLARDKYSLLGKKWPFAGSPKRYTESQMAEFARVLTSNGVGDVLYQRRSGVLAGRGEGRSDEHNQDNQEET